MKQHTRETITAFINECRATNTPIDLSWQDLSGLDMSGLDMSDANLQGSDLRDANSEPGTGR